jgi:C4-dicarboxylate-binding protein DctP
MKIHHALLAAACILCSSLSLAQSPIVIKFSHVAAPDTPKGQAADYFKKLVEERSKGRVKIEIYPNSILYKDGEELEALQVGSVQMLAPVISKFGPIGVKEFEAFDLPYLFADEDAVHRVTRGPLGASLLKKLEAKGFVGLTFWDSGFRVLSSNKPFKTPEQIKGQKIRINSSKVTAAIIKSIGALPQTMSLAEVYQALQTGVVDGTDGPIANLYTQKHYEVQKYITVTNHTYSGSAVVVNKNFWSQLPADVRSLIETAMKDATTYNDQVAEKDTDQAMAAIKASGKSQVYVPTAAERAQWVKAMEPVRDEMTPRVGKETVDAILKAAADPAAK